MIDDNQLENKPVKHIINELELLLAQKRTALSVLRTGITVILLPLSVFTVLLATSRYYDISKAWGIAIPLGIACLTLFALGIYLIIRAALRIRRFDRVTERLLKHSEYLRDLMDI
ncbi:MAG: hypothetical protein V3W18_00485 [candidate division Zixibacteria bacterium]